MPDDPLDGVDSDAVAFEGRIHLEECVLDIEVSSESVDVRDLSLAAKRCAFSPAVFDALERARRVRPDAVRLVECQRLPEPVVDAHSPGRFFLNKVMSLSRRHGHSEYAVYSYKLRGRTRATGTSFPKALEVLRAAGAIEPPGEMILLTEQAAEHRYSGKARPGLRRYEEVRDYWAPIVAKLDDVLR